jgi:hypothetical protein
MRALTVFGSLLLTASIAAACGGSSGDGSGAGPTGDTPDGAALDAPSLPAEGDGGTTGDTGGGTGDDSGNPTGSDASSGADAGKDATGGGDGGFVVANHPPFPLLVRGNKTAGLLTAPVIVPVFFPGYDHVTEVKDQLSKLGTVATYWKDAVGEYGIGNYTYGTPVMLTEAAPKSIAPNFIVSWLKEKLNGTHPEFGTPTDQWMYVIYYPKTTGVSGSCSDPAQNGIGYGGYHDAVTISSGTYAYGVIAECDNFGPTITNSLDMVTVAGSHEIIEAVTDTSPGDGYATIDQMPLDVFLQGNEENGDLCAVNHAFWRPGGAYPYLLSRGWSNKAAAAGNLDPCQPALADQPFIGAAPIMPETITVAGAGTGPGITIADGQSKTVDVQLWSTAPTVPFTVAAKQRRGESTLGFAWDKTTGVNGDVLKLTITVKATSSNKVEPFVVTADINGEQTPIWAGVVKN